MKFKRCMGIILFMVLMLTACSPDPRVAPFKAWIVGVDAPTVLYDRDYGTRILIMQKGEDADVEVIHNREPRHKVTIGAPKSDEGYVATVSDQKDGKFRIHAEDEGCAMVTVNIQGEKVQYLYGDNRAEAYVYVIVSGDEGDGITVKLSKINGSLVGNIEDAVLVEGDEITFTYTDSSNINIDHVDWYLDGIKIGTGETFTYTATTLGTYKIRCIIYGFKGGEWTLGHSDEMTIEVNM